MADVTIHEFPNFQGRSRAFPAGQHRLFDANDMNDLAASIRVPAGLVAIVYEHADSGGGYGIWVDLLEDCADLSQYDFDGKISCLNIFARETAEGLVWRRASLVDGVFVPGHWERKRARGEPTTSPVAVVAPPLPPHDFVQPVLTGGGTIAEPASDKTKNTVIDAFIPFPSWAQARWDHAVNSQMGIIGSDFRGPEEIGSAAFERASNVLPNAINFWYPQKQPRDHRRIVYFKRTCSGTLVRSSVTEIGGVQEQFYDDADLCIHIKPGPGYEYLVTDGHPREYTDIMSLQWTMSGHQAGQPDCDDPASVEGAELIEAEIDTSAQAKQRLNNVFTGSVGRQLCVYGPWIYDKGHCCHPEIHPAEQLWWSDPFGEGRVYFCNLFCDESGRFRWRDQMDDGTKLKPWAEPPITGTFAIAFETELNSPAKQFEIGVQNAHNHTTAAEGFERHHLVYQDNTLISVVQDLSNPVTVSFEDVGLVGGTTVRGFLVLAASVGRRTHVPGSGVPADADPSQVPELIEHLAFQKEGGRLMFTVARGVYRMF